MARILISSLLVATALSLAGCGKPPEKSATENPPAVSAPTAHKCPDPNIRDPKNPCSPYYWQPKDSALKNAKSF